MKRFTILAITAISFAVLSETRADSLFQFGFWAPQLQIVDETENVGGLRLDLFYGKNESVAGLDLGVANQTTGKQTGVQLGFANIVDGDMKGLQIGLWNQIDSKTSLRVFPIVNWKFQSADPN